MSAKGDCEALLDAVLSAAGQMLCQYREFYPYGGYMRPNGEIVDVGAMKESTDHPRSKELLALLRDSFVKLAAIGTCKATAIVFDVLVVPPGQQQKQDAIQVCLEHVDGYSAEVFLPYQIDQGGEVTYGTMFAQEGKREIFRGTDSTGS